MIVTKKFVMLNLPKTGTTFTVNILKKLYVQKKGVKFIEILNKLGLISPNIEELILPNLKMPNRLPDKHGTYAQIPKKHLHKPIISIVRNPYSRFLSSYKFRAWANPKHFEVSKEIIENHFPNFPNLTIDEYVDLNDFAESRRLKKIGIEDVFAIESVGAQTIQFIQMFFKDPKSALFSINDEYIHSKEYQKDMADIKFLTQENLNQDLIIFLKEQGFSERELEIVNNSKKLNKTKYKTDDVNDLWTEKALNYVTYKERYLFMILEDLNINYTKPLLNK
ncbi:sulfotransferase family 2 domain-containing protein [Polaribacter sp.]|uniref:sulfotransferase family 2 domain-containing protein n=1 Tax=Polaribacter sp. TaxID=1920175 RepID=UPI00329A466B